MEHRDKKPPRLWLLGYSLLPEDARGSNHSCRTKQQIFLHCCQNLLWAAKAGREGGLDGSHLLPKQDNAEFPSLWPFPCSVNYFHVFLSPREVPLTHLWALSALFPQLSCPQSAHLGHPQGETCPEICPPLFCMLYCLFIITSVVLYCLSGRRKQLILTWMQLILTICPGQKWAAWALQGVWIQRISNNTAPPLKKAVSPLPLHLTSNISTSINENNSPVATALLDFNHQVQGHSHISVILFLNSWSKSQHRQLCPGSGIMLRFSTTSKIVAKGKFSGLMRGKQSLAGFTRQVCVSWK